MNIKKMTITLLFAIFAGLVAIAVSSLTTIHFHQLNTQNTINTIEHTTLTTDAQHAVYTVKNLIVEHQTSNKDKQLIITQFKDAKSQLYHILPLLYLPRESDDTFITKGDAVSDELYDLVDVWLDDTYLYLKSDKHEKVNALDLQSKEIDGKFIELLSITHQAAVHLTKQSSQTNQRIALSTLLATSLLFLLFSYFLIKTSKKTTDRLILLIESINELTRGNTDYEIPFEKEKGDIGNIARAALDFRRKILDLEKTNQDIIHIANHDHLTGVANRRQLNNHFQSWLNNQKNDLFLFYIDLDSFKDINDYYGQEMGDHVLTSVAQSITNNLRKDDFLSRIGGNEFILLIDVKNPKNTIESFSKRLIQSINMPLEKDSVTINPNVSIGISTYPNDGEDLDELIKNARISLIQVKQKQRNSYLQVTPELKNQASQSELTRKELRLALKNKEIIPFFQPQVCLKNKEIINFEALARWDHPSKGILPPRFFIEDANTTELIEDIGIAILDASIEAIKKWEKLGLSNVQVSINVSHRELSIPNFYDKVIKKLIANNIDSSRIAFEVLETVAINNNSPLIFKNLQELYNYGISLHVDDFGVGYSSISSLQLFNFQKIKIDRSFICNHDDNSKNKTLLKSMIVLAHSLQIECLVEGVETIEQLGIIEEYGCHQIQGYLISEPLSFDDITMWWQQSPYEQRQIEERSS